MSRICHPRVHVRHRILVVMSTLLLDPRDLRLHREPPRRDVPFVPTDDAVVTAMLRFGHVGRDDVLYDLGCGDGRICVAAAKQYGCRAVGVDIDPLRIEESRERAAKARVGDRVRFYCQSFFEIDLHPATVVTLYLLPSINLKLRPKLLSELRPGARVIANYFEIGDWQPDVQANVHHRVLHQWIIPAWVAGEWHCTINHPLGRRRMILKLRRRMQMVTGGARIDGTDIPIYNGRLFGDLLSFRIANPYKHGSVLRLSARVEGTQMRGTCHEDAIEDVLFAWGGRWERG